MVGWKEVGEEGGGWRWERKEGRRWERKEGSGGQRGRRWEKKDSSVGTGRWEAAGAARLEDTLSQVSKC